MAETTNTATIKVVLDADGVEVGLRKIDDGAAKTGAKLEGLGKNNGINALGDGAEAAAGKFAGGTKTIIDSIQRRTEAMSLGKKGTVEYYAALAESKGINPAALKPYLDQLDAVTRKTAQAAEAQKKLDDGAAFINGLRARTQEIGKSASELAVMRAEQLGVSETAQPLIEQLRAAEEAASGLGGTLGIAGTALQAFAAAAVAALSISAVATGIQTAIDALADLDDMAQKSGSSVESLSQLQKVAQMVNQDFGEVNSAVNKLAKGMGGLDIDSNKVLGALKTLGVSAKDSAGKLRAPSDVMVEAAKKFQDYADGAGKAKLANDLFKGSGQDLLPYLNDVAENIDSFSGSSAGAATKASEFGDNVGSVKVRIGELWTEIATNMLPALVKFSKYVKDFTDSDRFKKFMTDAGTAAAGFASAIEKIAPVIVPAAKILATYFGLFVLLPNTIKLVMVSFELLWAAIQLGAAKVMAAGGLWAGLTTTLWGTGLAAQFASGWMGRLKIATGALFALIAGYQFGSYLYDEFAWARVGGLMFVEAMLIGFEKIKAEASSRFAVLAAVWDGTLGLMKTSFGTYLAGVAAGLKLIGASDVSKSVATYADSLLKAGATQIASAKNVGTAVAKTAAEYEKNVTAIRTNIKELTAYAALQDRVVVKGGKGGVPEDKPDVPETGNGEDVTKQASAYASLIEAIQSKIAANKLELSTSEAVSESEKLGIKLKLDMESKTIKLTTAQLAATKASLAELAVTEEKLKLQAAEKGAGEYIKQNTLARQASAAALASEYELYGKGADAREIAAVGLRNEAELQRKLADMQKAGLPVTQRMIEQMRASAQARSTDEQAALAQTKALGYAAQMAEENARFAAESIVDERERAAAILEIDANKRRKQLELAEEGTEAQKKVQQEFDTWYRNQSGKAAMDEWRKSVQQYDDIFRNGFADMLNNGKDGWKSFTKSLVTTFKTSVADQIYKMFIKPIIVQVIGNVVGGNGGGGGIMGLFGSSGGAGASGGNQYVSMAQSAKSAYDAIENGFTGLTSQMGGMVSTVGDFFGSSNVSAFGNGMSMGTGQAANAANAYNSAGMTSTGTSLNSGATAGSAATVAMAWLAAAQIGRKIGNYISDGYSVRGGSGNGLVNFTTLQASVPILGGLVGGLINRAFGRRPREITSSTLSGEFSGDGKFAGRTDSAWREKGGWFKSDKSGVEKIDVNETSAKEFASAYSSIKMAAADFATTLGINAESIATRTQKISIAITKDEEATKKAISDFFVGVGNQIALELVPSIGEFTKGTETASETLQRVASEYAFVDAALAAVGDTFGAVGVGSIKAREYLLELSGGMEAFGKDVAYFSQNYLTEAERLAPVAKTVEAAFAELQIAAPKTREQFKALVMGLDLTSTNGAKTYAGLMNIQEAFVQLTPAIEQVAEKVRTLADIKIERLDLQDQLDALKMSPADYADKQRLAARDKIDDSNKPLFDELTGAKAAAALAAINKSYEDQIRTYENAGKKLEDVRKREIEGMDATTVKLYNIVKAYEDSAAAAEKAAQLASVNKGYEDRIFEIEKPGKTLEEIRKREIEGMDETTVKLYDKLKALEAAQAAKEALDRAEAESAAAAQRDREERARQMQRIADEAARAAEQVKAAWQSVTDSIFAEVARIRGMASGTGAQSLASAQAEFAIKNAQAQAGNQDAAKLLPSISQKLIELAEANATSLIDLQRIRARTAASLDATGAILAARFGLTLPSLAVGTNYLPSDMMIQAHEGERVIPAADNRALMQMINRPAPADTSSAARQQANDEMAGLRAEVRSVAISSAATASLLKRVIKDDKLQTEDA